MNHLLTNTWESAKFRHNGKRGFEYSNSKWWIHAYKSIETIFVTFMEWK